MVKSSCNYLYISLLLVIVTLIVANCGGGSDTGAVPGVPQQQTEEFVTKDVSGYIYYSPSPEDTEGEKKFVILNAPLAGEDSFLNQLSSYYQEANPDFWNTSEMQSLYGTMSSEMGKWIPLPAYSPDARLYGIYQDSKSSSPIPVNSDGYFETTVQVKPADANVSFEVVTGDSDCYPVEGVSTSDIATSEEGATELISCPEQVITLPGWFVIFAVRGEPAINLKDSGLDFTLNDHSVGWVTEPFYLKCGGVWNYNVAYGIFLAKPGLSTPASTTITAQTVTGLSLNIFTEVVKFCASISGHVGGAGVIPEFGFVYSLGFDAFSCLDETGNYKLNKVFRGHFRNVTAVYWIQENGVLIKHREERVINFFDGDLVNFDLPEEIQPTPTFPPPPDAFYDAFTDQIISRKDIWQEELGMEQGRQKTVDWLNNVLSDNPLSSELTAVIRRAGVDEVNPNIMWYNFKNGYEVIIIDSSPSLDEILSAYYNKETFTDIKNESVESEEYLMGTADPTTLKNTQVLMLGTNAFQCGVDGERIFFESNSLRSTFKKMGFDVTSKEILRYNITGLGVPYDSIPNDFTQVEFYPDPHSPKLMACRIRDGKEDTVPMPENFIWMNNYGVIIIRTHAGQDAILASLWYEDDPNLWAWQKTHKQFDKDAPDPNGVWCEIRMEFTPLRYTDYKGYKFRGVGISPYFIAANNGSFEGSLIYAGACSGWEFAASDAEPFDDVKVFLGNSGDENYGVLTGACYDFFCFMLGVNPLDLNDMEPTAISVSEAYSKIETKYKLGPGGYGEQENRYLRIDTGEANENDNTYLPGYTHIGIYKDK